ncbi:MAG: phosphopyruvate hydratase [Candidatus Gottesmanbacteria bacterium]
MAKIKQIKAREILDSRGNPTVETIVLLDNGITGLASVPAGASLSKYEALELRDNDIRRYSGMGVLKAVDNVNNILAPKLIGLDPSKQFDIDTIMIGLDGTLNKSKLGSNSILSISLACAVAAANNYRLPLFRYINRLFGQALPNTLEKMPTPTFNIINGGKHGTGNLDFQEFHIIPASNKPYHEALMIGEEIYQKLKTVLIYQNAIYSVGDEGGFAPNLASNLDALEAIIMAIKSTRYSFGRDIFLGLDIASAQFNKGDGYHLKDLQQPLSATNFIKYLINLDNQYNLLILEDPLEEDNLVGWQTITNAIGMKTLIVGDDFLATNIERINLAITNKACNAALIKPNQVGTLTETLTVIKNARQGGLKIIVSHRSGETNDTFIADLAVAVAAEYVKFGAPARGERIVKYNRLLEIEELLNINK